MDYQQYLYGQQDFEGHGLGRHPRRARLGSMTRVAGVLAVMIAATMWLVGVRRVTEQVAPAPTVQEDSATPGTALAALPPTRD